MNTIQIEQDRLAWMKKEINKGKIVCVMCSGFQARLTDLSNIRVKDGRNELYVNHKWHPITTAALFSVNRYE